MIEFARMANVEFNQVPFKGPAEAVQMTHAGQIDFAAVPLSTAATSGLRMPGLFAPARNPAIPAVPTMKEQGFDIAPLSFGALVGPAGLPVSPGARSNPTTITATARRSRATSIRTSRKNAACWRRSASRSDHGVSKFM
jgi:tripartite-type tricarboxylate transporter receptor subunit TctC